MKKLLLGLGSVAVIAAPIALAVSCSSEQHYESVEHKGHIYEWFEWEYVHTNLGGHDHYYAIKVYESAGTSGVGLASEQFEIDRDDIPEGKTFIEIGG